MLFKNRWTTVCFWGCLLGWVGGGAHELSANPVDAVRRAYDLQLRELNEHTAAERETLHARFRCQLERLHDNLRQASRVHPAVRGDALRAAHAAIREAHRCHAERVREFEARVRCERESLLAEKESALAAARQARHAPPHWQPPRDAGRGYPGMAPPPPVPRPDYGSTGPWERPYVAPTDEQLGYGQDPYAGAPYGGNPYGPRQETRRLDWTDLVFGLIARELDRR